MRVIAGMVFIIAYNYASSGIEKDTHVVFSDVITLPGRKVQVLVVVNVPVVLRDHIIFCGVYLLPVTSTIEA
jgi:hypothetical protein